RRASKVMRPGSARTGTAPGRATRNDGPGTRAGRGRSVARNASRDGAVPGPVGQVEVVVALPGWPKTTHRTASPIGGAGPDGGARADNSPTGRKGRLRRAPP